MMRIKLKEELSFIAQPGLKEFSIEEVNGVRVIKEGKFKQNIKDSEYAKILENKVEEVEKVNEKVKKSEKKVKARKTRKPKNKPDENVVAPKYDKVTEGYTPPEPEPEPEIKPDPEPDPMEDDF